jgi:hypothetical protein
MSDSPPAPATRQTTFFKHVVGVNPAQHGGLKLDRSVGYGFAAAVQAVPLALNEIETAAQHFPVLFTRGETPQPIALLGLQDGNNLFVDSHGAWLPDSYVPAYLRTYPFALVEDPKTKTVYLGLEADAACLSNERGAPLFEDGKATPALNEAVAFCQAYREGVVAAISFGRALEAAGVLREEEANIRFTAGGNVVVRGFKLVKPDLLAEVDDATFIEWRRMGWVAAIYAHLFSAGRWGRLIELAAVRAPAQS